MEDEIDDILVQYAYAIEQSLGIPRRTVQPTPAHLEISTEKSSNRNDEFQGFKPKVDLLIDTRSKVAGDAKY